MKEQLDLFVPIEVLPYAKELVMRYVRELEGEPQLRLASRKDGPVITDNGNFVIDASFGTIDNVEALSIALSMCPGVVEHGLFTDVADMVFVGNKDGSVKRIDTLDKGIIYFLHPKGRHTFLLALLLLCVTHGL
jgi:ribose 5-phosphate isomerase A